METITLQGIKLQNYKVVPFQKEILKTVDLEVFTPKRVHYLVNALVNNTKLPSQQAMIRSQKRNQVKSGADKADQVVGRAPRGGFSVRRMPLARPFRRSHFNLPQRYGRLPQARRNRGGRRGFGRGRLPNLFGNPVSIPVMRPIIVNGVQMMQTVNPIGLPQANLPLGPNGLPIFQPNFVHPIGFSSVNPPQIPVANQPQKVQAAQSIQAKKENEQKLKKKRIVMQKKREEIIKKIPQVVRKVKKETAGKQKSNAFKTHDPEWIVLKAYKTETCQIVEKYREDVKKDKEPVISENLKNPVPLYFQKKKASQKRRRLQKHELIKKNRKDLVEIFGNAIFQRGWPISRKQIKEALGIIQQEPMDVENLSDFINMAEESMSLESQSSVSRMSEEVQP